MPLTSNGTEVYVYTMTNIISCYYDSLGETLNHLKSLKLKFHPGGNVAYFCGAILLYAEHLEYSEVFNTDHLGNITHIYKNNSDPIFHL